MNESKIVTAIDIANSKVQVFVGEIVDRRELRIISAGNTHSFGIKKSNILDIQALSKSVEEAILKAEKRIKIDNSKVYISMSGSHLEGMKSLGSANIRSADNVVSQEDIKRANADAMSKTLPEDRTFINMINCGYYLDGEFCQEPLGKIANRIDAEYWLVHGDCDEIAKIVSVLKNLDIEADELVLSSIASALAVSTKNDRNEGVLVIDIGAGTTDYVIYKNSKVSITGSISVGGEHITNDLAHGIRLCQKNAEKLKKVSKATMQEDERKGTTWALGDKQIGDRKVPLKAINTIIKARLEETFLLVRDELANNLNADIQCVILTGGTANMLGITEVAQGVFNKKCIADKFNSNVHETFRRNEHATCIGLLNYAFESEIHEAQSIDGDNLFSKIFKVFK
ncbi:MAG: cell division protein FtsA [Opitutales bacterium]